NLNIIAYELDQNGTFLLSRGKGLEKLGLKPDEVVGKSLYDIYRDHPKIIETFRSALTGISRQLEIEVNNIIWSANFVPMKNADGELDRIFGTAIDITERKRAEEAFVYESELWHTLMEHIPDTIYFKDINSRFTKINKTQADIIGVRSEKDAIGKTDFDFFDHAHAQQAYTDEQQIIATGEPILGKPERVILKDGRVCWFSTTKVAIRSKNGDIIGIVGSSRDISDLKQAEELEIALFRIAEEASSTGDLQKLFSTIHGIIGGLMYANNFYIALYDSQKDLLSFPYFVDEIDVPPEPGKAGRGLTAYVLRTGQSILCDQKLSDELERKGEAELVGVPCPIWLGVPLIVEGKTIGVMVVQHYSDATVYGEREKHILEFVSTQVAKAIEGKQAQEALKQSEDRYRAFVEQSTEGIWRFESDYPISITLPEDEQVRLFYEHAYIAECNDAMAHMYGFSRASDFVGARLSEMLIPTDPRNLEILKDFIHSGYRLNNAESHEMDKHGNVKIFLNNFVGFIDNDILRVVWGTQTDVTERRHAEDLLIHSEEKYRTLFEESQDCIILSTPDGRLVDINPAGVELFGYTSKEELLKLRDASDLYFNPEDRELFISRLAQYRYVKDLELSIKRKDGEKRTVLENASAVRDVDGPIIAYRSFLRDITERKKLEDQLRQAQKMESIGTLAGGIAHDFNNILGIILGYTSLIQGGSVEPTRISQSLDIIKKAVQRGADLVRQLLTFARKGEPTFSAVNINDVINELMKMLNQTFPKTITIESNLIENPPSIVADSSQLHLALLNLCVNARDAMVEDKPGSPGGGTLTLRTGVVKQSQLLSKFPDAQAVEYISIMVKDTGVGMDEETRNRVFEPFFTTKELGKGTGLGLAVVYGVINSHHGFVDVESTKGIGTTFTLYFPAIERKPEVVETIKTTEAPISSGHETILIVEDEQMLANLLSSILSDQGYKTLVACDGQEGVDIFTANKDNIDLILSDMGLPRLGGYEMFMKIKELKPTIKAVLASGYFDLNLKKELMDAGAKDFIQKPYVPELIIKRIREILDEEKK
ncbi:MAG: PAS domain S-box protein, partial [Ignavibacteriales bacterium]|nr:PAS domain S-box protein [Ignavibacteriales bacterium]